MDAKEIVKSILSLTTPELFRLQSYMNLDDPEFFIMLRELNRAPVFEVDDTFTMVPADSYTCQIVGDPSYLAGERKKIGAIKVLRNHTGMYLRDSKEAVEGKLFTIYDPTLISAINRDFEKDRVGYYITEV